MLSYRRRSKASRRTVRVPEGHQHKWSVDYRYPILDWGTGIALVQCSCGAVGEMLEGTVSNITDILGRPLSEEG